MKKLFEDKFITKLIGYKSYIVENNIDYDVLNFLKKPFFITLKSNSKKKILKSSSNFKIKFVTKLITYERKHSTDLDTFQECREVNKKDISQLRKICLEDTSNSRYYCDKNLPFKFRKKFRLEWVLNFFKKKRGDLLVVAYNKKKILGFISLLKKNFGFQIDLIVTKKNYQNKKVGTSLINYVNNKYLKKNEKIKAGTQLNNLNANIVYKKIGFKQLKTFKYVYHIHSKN